MIRRTLHVLPRPRMRTPILPSVVVSTPRVLPLACLSLSPCHCNPLLIYDLRPHLNVIPFIKYHLINLNYCLVSFEEETRGKPIGAKPSRESPSVFHQLVKNPSSDNKLTKTNKQKRQMAKRKTHTHTYRHKNQKKNNKQKEKRRKKCGDFCKMWRRKFAINARPRKNS